MNLLLSNPLAF